MSVQKLESMLKKLEQSTKIAKNSAKGGFVGLGHDARLSGGVLTGGVLTGGILTGGKKKKCKGGEISNFAGGEISNFAGGEISNFAGGVKCGGKKKKCKGGEISNFAGGVKCGGQISNFAGGVLSGGICPTCEKLVICECKNKKKCKCEDEIVSGGILSGGVLYGGSESNFAGVQGGRMRSDYRSYNSATEQRGNKKGALLHAPLPYGYNAVDTNVSGGKTKKASISSKKAPQLNAWRNYLNEFRNAHPNMSLKEAMSECSKSYKK